MSNGNLGTSGGFYTRAKYKASIEELEEIKKLPLINFETIKDIDNPDKYNWYEIGNDHYNRFMYCPKTHTKRTQTMGEFYGSGVVD